MPGSLPISLFESEEGRAMKNAKSAAESTTAGAKFFGGLGKGWAEASLELCKKHRPKVGSTRIAPTHIASVTATHYNG